LTELVTLVNTLADAYRTGEIPESETPENHLPYESWKDTLNPLLHESLIQNKSEELKSAFPGIETSPDPIEFLIQYQEAFFQQQYNDPAFTIDRNTLHLSEDRIADITASLERGETDFPVIVAPPRAENLTKEETSDPSLASIPRTLTRVLFDRLIREKNIKFWDRAGTIESFLDQTRDLTLQDLTRNELPPKDPLHIPVPFDTNNWSQYLTALYPTLSRPAVIIEKTNKTPPPVVSFMKWEQNPPKNRIIRNTTETIGDKSWIDAVTHRYPLATLTAYLTLFAQHYEKTGKALDILIQRPIWSVLFGVLEPSTASGSECIFANWSINGLGLHKNHPWFTGEGSALRYAC
ncbi:MAG: hypothetical protein Q7S96_01705, partial [bacterium]|nr:hypothetical protein [bacterium]